MTYATNSTTAALRCDAEAARLVLAETRRTHPHVAAELLRVLTERPAGIEAQLVSLGER